MSTARENAEAALAKYDAYMSAYDHPTHNRYADALADALSALLPEVDADPDTAFELGRVAGYDEAMREVFAPTEGVREALARALYDIDPLPLHRGEGDEERIVGPKPWEWLGEGYHERLRTQADAILDRFHVSPKEEQ